MDAQYEKLQLQFGLEQKMTSVSEYSEVLLERY